MTELKHNSYIQKLNKSYKAYMPVLYIKTQTLRV